MGLLMENNMYFLSYSSTPVTKRRTKSYLFFDFSNNHLHDVFFLLQRGSQSAPQHIVDLPLQVLSDLSLPIQLFENISSIANRLPDEKAATDSNARRVDTSNFGDSFAVSGWQIFCPTIVLLPSLYDNL